MDTIRVLVVDDHPLFRQGVAHTLNQEEDMEVVAEADDATTALDKARSSLPDVVLLDIKLPGQSGLDVVRHLQRELPYCKVVMLTVYEDDDALLKALTEGARGYVVKGVSGDELVQAIRAVQAGETYVTSSMAGRLLTQLAHPGSPKPAQNQSVELTDRERSILELVAQGQTNKEIAAAVFLSEKTVKHYMTNILQKLQVRNRVEAALKARGALHSR